MISGNRTIKALLLFLALGMAVGMADASPGHAAGDVPPRIVFETCGFRNPVAGRDLRCGRLEVPARRDRDSWDRYRLPLAILGVAEEEATGPPVIFLNGGPGIASIGGEGGRLALWSELLPALPWLEGRDLILLDPRGVGGAEPAASCQSELWRLHLDDGRNALTAALRDCWARLRQDGHALASFNSREAAADVIDLARALKLESWDIWGHSYGTRLALLVMAAAPERLRAALLMGAYPPGVDAPLASAQAFYDSLEGLFRACEADAACAKSHPDLRAKLARALAAQRRQPITLTAHLTRGFGARPHRINDRLLLSLLHESLYTTAGLSALPKLLSALADEDYGPLESPVDRMDQAMFGPGSGFAARVLYHCNDLPATPANDLARARRAFPTIADWIAAEDLTDFCQSGSLGNPDVQLPAGVPMSATATLILAGRHDPATPPAWSEMTAAALMRARHILLPASSHDLHLNACAGNISRQFLQNPDAPIDRSCLDQEKLPPFEVD